MTELNIPAGTIVHIAGYPFEVPEGTVLLGTENNLAMALEAIAERNIGKLGCFAQREISASCG